MILHFGDHDPSGIDMTRDICDRLELFGAQTEVLRVALNMPQVEEYRPPPNPAKVTDSRFVEYRRRHGGLSWELDALEPQVLADLVRARVEARVDHDQWEEDTAAMLEERRLLRTAAERWADVAAHLNNNGAGS